MKYRVSIQCVLLCRPPGAVLAFGPLPQSLQLPVLQRLRDRRGWTESIAEGAAGAANEDVCSESEDFQLMYKWFSCDLLAVASCVLSWTLLINGSDVFFQLSCKLEREFRCVELAELMTQNVVTLAIRYASKSRRMALAQRLSEIALEKANQVQEEEPEEEEEEEQDYSSVRRTTSG